MAARLSIKLEGGAKLKARLDKLNPAQNFEIFRRSAKDAAVLIVANARNVQIRRGGGAVHSTQLTHRSFHLRNSIGVDFRGLPRFVEAGTDVLYGAKHEHGIDVTARPFMAPALEAIRPQIPAIVVRNWKREGGI